MSPNLRQRMQSLIGEVECGSCGGSRLRDDAAAVRFRRSDDRWNLPTAAGRAWSTTLKKWKLDAREKKIAGELIREIGSRVEFLNDVGLEYLTLDRTAASLVQRRSPTDSSGQSTGQRAVRRACTCLDEPTIGLASARQYAIAESPASLA